MQIEVSQDVIIESFTFLKELGYKCEKYVAPPEFGVKFYSKRYWKQIYIYFDHSFERIYVHVMNLAFFPLFRRREFTLDIWLKKNNSDESILYIDCTNYRDKLKIVSKYMNNNLHRIIVGNEWVKF